MGMMGYENNPAQKTFHIRKTKPVKMRKYISKPKSKI